MEDSSSNEKTKGIRWSKKEDVRYHFYLLLHYESMLIDGRQARAFTHMHRFIPNKTSGQCRSHHQKRVKKNNNSLDLTLSKFYREHYT